MWSYNDGVISILHIILILTGVSYLFQCSNLVAIALSELEWTGVTSSLKIHMNFIDDVIIIL